MNNVLSRVKSLFCLAIAIIGLLTSCEQRQRTASIPDQIDFNFHVRPILVQNCYLCHGPDATSRKAGLRLDTFEGATAELKEGGFAIVPGKPGKSKLLDRIRVHDPELVMPPPETKLTLSEREISILTKWIEQGAEWKKHWAFNPPVAPRLDEMPDGKNEIDYLLEQEIKDHELEIAPEAEAQSLIRRVSYVLTGLPPTPDELNGYLQDKSGDAYERMVDYYLNSQHFGEKWARHWMDVVRYAETKGHEFDYTITGAWRYRDYLIRAFNSDLSYDQFVKEHLAGDLLSEVRFNKSGVNESQLATAFYTMTEGAHSPVDTRKDEADRIDNMIDVTSKAFQSLTVSCARCHDHKFDPISTADYYALYGVMESTRFSPAPADLTITEQQNVAEVEKLQDYIRTMVGRKWSAETAASGQAVVQTVKHSETADYMVIGDFRGSDLNGWKSDGLAFGSKTTLGKPVFNTKNELIRLSTGKASSRIVSTGLFGALRSPNFTIEKDNIGVRAYGKGSTVRVIMDNLQLISYPIYGSMDQRVEKESGQNLLFDVSLWKGHKAYVEILPGSFNQHVYNLPKDSYVEVDYVIAFNGPWKEPEPSVSSGPLNIKQAIERWTSNEATPEQIGAINNLLKRKAIESQFPEVADVIGKTTKLTEGLGDSTFFNSIKDGFAIDSKVFVRGDHQQLGKTVPRRFLSAIATEDSVFTKQGSGRMELAQSIISPGNPLTSRVMVNRIWYYLFGRGIVETVDNFGLQGKLPTHPQLLDYLAIRFQKEGWSSKKMIRYIMMSDAFRRSIVPVGNTETVDPENLLLSHYPRRRLEAEQIRDALLAASGRLDTTMFGKPVPVHITAFMQGRGKPGTSGPLDGNGRRSVYQEVRRNFLEPMMLTFDRPLPFTTFGKRNVTNVPAQSLIMMNDPFVIQQSEVMARKLIAETKPDLDRRFEWIFERTYSRKPSTEELAKAREFVSQLAKLHHVNEKDVPDSLVVWKDYCHSVFNSKEFIYLI